jgi:hypothetical protein
MKCWQEGEETGSLKPLWWEREAVQALESTIVSYESKRVITVQLQL